MERSVSLGVQSGGGSTVGGREQRAVPASADARLRIVRDPLRILLVLLTIVTVSRVHQHYPVLAKLRPALLLVIAAAVYAYLNPRQLARVNVLRLWPMRCVALLGIVACCSAVFGISLGRSASFIIDSYAKTLLYAFLIAVSIRGVRDLYTYVWAYVLSCGILTYFSLFVFGLATARNSYVTRLNNLYTYDSNDLGVVLMIGVALTLLLLVVVRGLPRWLLLANLVMISAAVARSGSRGGFLGFAAVGIASLILANAVSAGRRLAVLGGALVALALGAPPGYWKQMGTLLEPKDDYNYSSINGRKALMERGIGYMVAYPVFGLGIDNFARAECTISSKVATAGSGPLRCTPPHNSFVQAGAELGVTGLSVWLALIVGGVVGMLRLRRRLPKGWRRGTESQRFVYHASSFLALSLIGFAVPAFFVTFAWMDPLYLLAALMTGLYVAVRREGERDPAAFPDATKRTTPQHRRVAWRGEAAGEAAAAWLALRHR